MTHRCDIPTGLKQGRDPEPERKEGGGHLGLPRIRLGRVPNIVLVSEPLIQSTAAGNFPPHEPSYETSVCLSTFTIGHRTLGEERCGMSSGGF